MSENTPSLPSDGMQVFAMDAAEFAHCVRYTDVLDEINAGWGCHHGEGIRHATSADRAAIEARQLIARANRPASPTPPNTRTHR